MSTCKKHNVEHNWTCFVCEAMWDYVGRTNLIDYFNDGFRGNFFTTTDPEERGAYAHGERLARQYKESQKVKK
jgi:hypothetical protein